jgi:hypothetical protein
MRVNELPQRALALPWVALICATGWLSPSNAQEPHRDIPANAHYSSGAQGWVCNSGFRQVAGLCMESTDDVPSWSEFEVFDGQWRCRSGYHRAGSYCVPATAPPHATYIAGGDRWECDWGFQKIASHCEEIKPPPHAYLDATGRDWVCYPGFERKLNRCVPTPAIAPPAGTTPIRSEELKPGAESPPEKR